MTNNLKRTDLEEIFTAESHILESITDGFFSIDSDWNFTYVNHVFEEVLGMNREHMIGANYWDCFPDARELDFYKHYHIAMENRVSVHFEAYYPPLKIWVAVNAYPTENGLAVYFQDITDKKNTQNALYSEGQNLKAIINNTVDLIWSVDLNFKIICANNAFLKRDAETDYPANGGTENKHASFSDKTWINLYKKALLGKSFKKIRKYTFRKQERYEEIGLNPIYGKNDEITGICCISRDITEEHKFQKELEERNQRLKEIAWIQSHQLRNHVANLLGLTEVLSCEICDANMITMIKSSVERIDTVLREVCVQAEG